MKNRVWIGLVLASMVWSCAPEGTPQAMIITQNLVISAEQKCKIKGTAAAVELRPIGTMDLLATNRYLMFPTVKSGFAPASETSNQSPDLGALDPNHITVSGARVWYEIDGLLGTWDGTDNSLPNEIFVPTSGGITPGGSGTFAMEVIPPFVGKLLDKDMAFDELYSGGYIIAHVVLVGRTLDGTSIESNEFTFPIILCRGCLMYWAHGKWASNDGSLEDDPDICFPGQDEPLPANIVYLMLDMVDRELQKKEMVMGFRETLEGAPLYPDDDYSALEAGDQPDEEEPPEEEETPEE